MSMRLIARVWEVRGLPPEARLVLLRLADLAGDDGAVAATVAGVAEQCRLCESQVYAALTRLRVRGLVCTTDTRDVVMLQLEDEGRR